MPPPAFQHCRYCSLQFGSASLSIHEKRCRARPSTAPELPTPHTRTKGEAPADEAPADDTQLVPCRHCGRTFFPHRLAVHERSCVAIHGGPKRSPAPTTSPPPPPRPTSSWREKHRELQEAFAGARGGSPSLRSACTASPPAPSPPLPMGSQWAGAREAQRPTHFASSPPPARKLRTAPAPLRCDGHSPAATRPPRRARARSGARSRLNPAPHAARAFSVAPAAPPRRPDRSPPRAELDRAELEVAARLESGARASSAALAAASGWRGLASAPAAGMRSSSRDGPRPPSELWERAARRPPPAARHAHDWDGGGGGGSLGEALGPPPPAARWPLGGATVPHFNVEPTPALRRERAAAAGAAYARVLARPAAPPPPMPSAGSSRVFAGWAEGTLRTTSAAAYGSWVVA